MRRLVLVLSLLLAAPAEGAVVAREGDTVLRARVKDGRICLRVEPGSGSGCQPRPLSPFQPAFASTFFGALDRAPEVLAAAVVPAAVEADVDGVRVPTVSADGFRERFLLVGGDVDLAALVRFYDAGGAMIGAARNDFARFEDDPAGPVLLRRAGVRIRAERDFQLRPDPLRLDRTVPTTCLDIATRGGSSGTCRVDQGAPQLELSVEARCAPRRSVITGTVDPRVVEVELTLGSGRRTRIAVDVPPAPFAGVLGLVVAALPRGEAVRSARGIDDTGRTRGFSVLRARPGGLPCPPGDDRDGGSLFGFEGSHPGPRTAGVPVAQAAGRELFAGDSRDRGGICVAFDRPRAGCFPAPVDSAFFSLERAGGAIGGVVAADVATVTLNVADGEPVTVPTTDGAAYRGRFAGRVRFLAAQVPAGAVVANAVARAADGRRLGRGFAYGRASNAVAARVAAGLVVRNLNFTGAVRPFFCIGPREARGLATFNTCGRFRSVSVTATASCAPRRLLIYGYLPSGVRGADVVLAGGERRPARVVRLDPRAGGGRVFVARVPRTSGVRAVVFSGDPPRPHPRAPRPDRRQPLLLPPASEQCGYDAFTGF